MSDNNDDYEPVYATLHFYYDDPDSMARYKACNEALDVLRAVEDFERWIRNTIQQSDTSDSIFLENVRASLFQCFTDNDVTVPGWE